ncbi:MAG: DUF6525 family protein [Pseudomonadota bacterium]
MSSAPPEPRCTPATRLPVTVIVNDMSEVNINADLKRAATEFSRTDETLLEMSNGCICCTLRNDLLAEVRRLAAEGRFDYLLIESTGISEPLPVATTFDFRDEDGESPSDVARLNTMVTVVDAVNLLNDYSSHEFLSDRGEVMGDEDERTLLHLLTDQIEFADVVILNKTADAGPERTDAARKIIRSLNADVEIIETNHSDVAAEAILDTGLFDLDKAHEYPMWAKELYGFADHVPETEEYGVSSYVYRARRAALGLASPNRRTDDPARHALVARFPLGPAPPPLRAWLAHAVLPWRPRSALRAYNRALAQSGAPAEALAELDRLQAARLEGNGA